MKLLLLSASFNFCYLLLICIMSSSTFTSNVPTVVTVQSRNNDDLWWESFHRRMQCSWWQYPKWNCTCPHCHTLLLTGEDVSFCCSDGTAITPSLPPLSHGILSLYNHRNILLYSRQLNSLFSFTAIGASKGFQKFCTGIWNVAITGRTYHHIFDVTSTEHSIHWYLYDEQDRLLEAANRKVPASWITSISADLQQIYPYVHHLHQFSTTWNNNPEVVTALELADIAPSRDFATIMHANDTVNIHPHSIVIWHNSDDDPSFIPIFSRHYKPLQYPLLFPHGTLGWGLLADEQGHLHKVLPLTQREWYKNLLLTEDWFLLFSRLTSEYICDMYSRIEEEHLCFIHKGRLHHAHKIQDDPYLKDSDDIIDICLPVSFLRSREWCSSEAADALALAHEFGWASLFITMTCNSEWPEILNHLWPGQTVYDVPVVIARAFKQCLQWLFDILNTMFRTVVYIIHVIEFQKRGFPHAHIVLKVCQTSSAYWSHLNFSLIVRLLLSFH